MSAVVIDLLQDIADVVGAEHVRSGRDAVCVSPSHVHEIAEVLRFANARGLVVSPFCGATKLNWGNPVHPSIQVDFSRMNMLREHAWQDMTCTVEAGCTWGTMQAELAEHGQMVALDALWSNRASIGGVVATNDSGAMRLKYGGLRDLILGMTVVLADGTIAKTGGKVVKNVAGYDLHKLLCGSFGTLGIIAEVNFRLHPIEAHKQTWTVTAPDVRLLDAPLRAFRDSQMEPSSLQLRTFGNGFALDLRIASLPQCLSSYEPQIEAICGDAKVQPADDTVWQSRQELFDRLDAVILKVSVLPSTITATVGQLMDWASELDANIRIVVQATGVMTIAVEATQAATVALVNKLRKQLQPEGGSVVVLQMPELSRSELDVWAYASDALPLMREIKRRFDPAGILNPGRFVGGI